MNISLRELASMLTGFVRTTLLSVLLPGLIVVVQAWLIVRSNDPSFRISPKKTYYSR